MRSVGLGDGIVEQLGDIGGGGTRPRQPQLEREGEEVLLSALVQVALETAACLVGVLDDPTARSHQTAAGATASAASSARSSIRCSLPAGSGSVRVVTTATVPHTSPETITGAPTEDCTPIARI